MNIEEIVKVINLFKREAEMHKKNIKQLIEEMEGGSSEYINACYEIDSYNKGIIDAYNNILDYINEDEKKQYTKEAIKRMKMEANTVNNNVNENTKEEKELRLNNLKNNTIIGLVKEINKQICEEHKGDKNNNSYFELWTIKTIKHEDGTDNLFFIRITEEVRKNNPYIEEYYVYTVEDLEKYLKACDYSINCIKDQKEFFKERKKEYLDDMDYMNKIFNEYSK